MLLPGSRELIVFGPLSVQDEIATRIAAHESTVTLLQSIDTESFDARELAIALNAALAAGMFGDATDSAPRIVADDSAGRVYVWAKEPQLASILHMAAKWKDIRKTASRPCREPSAGQSGDSTRLGKRRPRSARAGMDDRDASTSNDRSELAPKLAMPPATEVSLGPRLAALCRSSILKEPTCCYCESAEAVSRERPVVLRRSDPCKSSTWKVPTCCSSEDAESISTRRSFALPP